MSSRSGKTFDVINPANGTPFAVVARGEKEDIDQAVKAARKAFEGGPWRRITASERGRLIWTLADRIEEELEAFATLETLDNGKPITVARVADVPLVIDHFRYYAGWATKIEGETIPISVPYAREQSFFNYTLRKPIGVVGQIIPWNFPLLMAAWKLGAALACGNCVVLKERNKLRLSDDLLRLQRVVAPLAILNFSRCYAVATEEAGTVTPLVKSLNDFAGM